MSISELWTILIFIDKELTAVGGEDGSRYNINKLYALRQREKYPPMNTARSSPAVVTTSDGEYLIVIEGSVGRFSWKELKLCTHFSVQVVKCRYISYFTFLYIPTNKPPWHVMVVKASFVMYVRVFFGAFKRVATS